MNSALKCVLLLVLLICAESASAGTDTEEWARRIKTAETLGALGSNLFGDSTNFYNGQTGFTQTDIDLPGNNSLPVRVARTYSASQREGADAPGLMSDWELDIPYMSGLFAQGAGWQVKTTTPNNRCTGASQFMAPPDANTGQGNFYAREYWRGNSLYVPGHGQQTLLKPSSNMPVPSDGQTTRMVTSTFWQIRCLPQLANGGASTGFSGEGFVALAPDGTKYFFDWMTSRSFSTVIRVAGLYQDLLARVEIRIYPTRVEDRFGNWVTYTYSGTQLSSVVASDGRQIAFTYNASGTIGSATVNGRTWTYGYDSSGWLNSVTLPDQSTWTFATSGLRIVYWAPPARPAPPCYEPGEWIYNYERTFTFKHPSGAIGEFTFTPTRHGRSQITKQCTDNLDSDNRRGYGPPILTDNFALTRKRISGPGLTPNVWTMAYSPAQGGFVGDPVPDTAYVDVVNPDLTTVRHTFGIRYYIDEGKLLSTETRDASGTLLRTESNSYALNPVSPPYPYLAGSIGVTNYDAFAATYIVPQTQAVISQQGDTYTNTVNSFNNFAKPLSVTRSNSLGATRTDVTAYFDATRSWVLSQISSATNSNTGLVESATIYYPDLAGTTAPGTPQKIYAFGQLKQTLSYNADGTIATAVDGLNRTTTLSNWKRGAPQFVGYQDATSESAVIDNSGWISSVTDARSNVTSYGYDILGRLTSLTYPTGDMQAWASKGITYVQLTAAELGMPIGTWRMRLIEANHQRSVYYDARFNPVLEEEKDTTTGNLRYVRRTFDYEGRKTFESYPSFSSNPTAGVNSTYDALGRLKQRQTTDGITLEQDAYLSGNRKQITDADGKVTIISYQVFDQPNYGKPTQVVAPEGQTTSIGRDVFGKITNVTQSGLYSGSTLSFTRTFTYDTYQRPCRRTDPESGSTVWGYDAASEITWEAKGQAGNGCLSSAPSGATLFLYDLRGRKTLDDYPGTVDDVTYGYDANGNAISVSNTTAVWSYGYNKRNLLESEQAVIDGKTFVLDPTYDSLAHLASRTTPTRTINYNPDAWGRPTQIGAYAGNIQYHPNGLPSGYILGNGLSYSQTLNTLQRPDVQITSSGASLIQKYIYAYSNAGDLSQITDVVDGSDNVTLAYDNLHRLTNATGLWGGFGYAYDPLNNIRSRTGPGALTYSYGATTNLLTTISGGASRIYSYNARGEIIGDGSKTFTVNSLGQISSITGVATYAYDGNGKRIKTAKGSAIEYSLYDRAGQLVYSENSTAKTDYLSVKGQMIAELKLIGSTTTATYLHADLLGSPRKATSQTQALVWQEHYDPYGLKLNGVNDKIGYTGHAYDSESGYTYMQARFYDAAVGRFLSIDPVGFQDSSPFTFNRYSYANNNPYRYTDPTGMCPIYVSGCNYSSSLEQLVGTRGEATRLPTAPSGRGSGVASGNAGGTSAPKGNGSSGSGSANGGAAGGSNGAGGDMATGGRNASSNPPQSPPGVSLDANMKIGQLYGNLNIFSRYNAFYNAVRNSGPMDYKQSGSQFQAFGNFNYGAVGAAAGFFDQVLLRAAGWAQQRAGTSTPAWGGPLGGSPYGDDPNDQQMIQNGIDYYNRSH
jgi:RHS repeat-associated protein